MPQTIVPSRWNTKGLYKLVLVQAIRISILQIVHVPFVLRELVLPSPLSALFHIAGGERFSSENSLTNDGFRS